MKYKLLIFIFICLLGGILYSYRLSRPRSLNINTQNNTLPSVGPESADGSKEGTAVKSLPFSRPSQWTVWQHPSGVFSFTYDPSVYQAPLNNGQTISLTSSNSGLRVSMKLVSYDNGSRHTFLKNQSQYVRLKDTYEKEYLIAGKPALFIYKADLSGDCSVGAFFLSKTQALMIYSPICYHGTLEPLLATFEFAN